VIRAVAALFAATCPGLALADALYPAAQCAAFVLGRDDYAQVSAYLDRDPDDPAFARALRDVAVRLNGGAAGEVDAFIAAERKLMALMFEAFIYGGDSQSRDLHDRMVATCEDFAATQPETRDLR
jgi:hypothetical protein